MQRRKFIYATAAGWAAAGLDFDPIDAAVGVTAADYTIRIEKASVEVANGRVVRTTTYTDEFPGPLVRRDRRNERTRSVDSWRHQ